MHQRLTPKLIAACALLAAASASFGQKIVTGAEFSHDGAAAGTPVLTAMSLDRQADLNRESFRIDAKNDSQGVIATLPAPSAAAASAKK